MNKVSQVKNINGMEIEEEGMVIDLVCGMELEAKEIELKSTYKGKVYYFCSEGCKQHFDNDPEKYAE